MASNKDQNSEMSDGSDPEFLGEIIVSKGDNKNSEAPDPGVDRLPDSMPVNTSDAWTDPAKDTISALGSVGIFWRNQGTSITVLQLWRTTLGAY